jgi:Putative prokaryotic signal transducing protein
MATPARDDIVPLTTASNPAQAHIWQQVLEGEGIQCEVVGDYLDAGIGDIPGMQAELWVHRDDAERALDILRNTKVPREPGSEDADEMSESV